jgi:NAD(P)-dependent dehydrogenase (short-subunit alcohol dehydrogenase family)
VNNAGMTSSTSPDDLDGVELAEWDRVFAVNVRGLFQVTRACADRIQPVRHRRDDRGRRRLRGHHVRVA